MPNLYGEGGDKGLRPIKMQCFMVLWLKMVKSFGNFALVGGWLAGSF